MPDKGRIKNVQEGNGCMHRRVLKKENYGRKSLPGQELIDIEMLKNMKHLWNCTITIIIFLRNGSSSFVQL